MLTPTDIQTAVTIVASGTLYILFLCYLGTRERPCAPTIYIAAPFAPCDGLNSAENTRHAMVLAAIYKRRGYNVTCVHPDILAGKYGDDNDPKQRADGARLTRAKCVNVARNGGQLAVLLRPAGVPSAGTADEIADFIDNRRGGVTFDVWRWNESTNQPEEVA